MIDDSIFILYYIHSYTIIESLDKSMAAKTSPFPIFSELQAMLRWPDAPVSPGLPRNYFMIQWPFQEPIYWRYLPYKSYITPM